MRWWPARIGLIRTLWAEARLAGRLLREPRVPALTKAVPILALLYAVAPVDAVPDLMPIIGQLDDLTLLLAASQIFRRIAPARVVAYHQSAVAGRQPYAPMPAVDDVIDGEWRRENTP